MPMHGVVDYSSLSEEQLLERADTRQRIRRLIATASPRADVIRAPINRLYRSLDETYRLGGLARCCTWNTRADKPASTSPIMTTNERSVCISDSPR